MSSIGNKEIFARNLSYYVDKSGKSQKELAEVAGVAPSTFNDWMKAKKYPRIDKIEILANYFRILKSDLIEVKSEEHREMQKENNTITDVVLRMTNDSDFFDLVETLHKLDSEKIASVKQMLSAFLK
jgi:transcriptional regulator with XRE-family HTH domain